MPGLIADLEIYSAVCEHHLSLRREGLQLRERVDFNMHLGALTAMASGLVVNYRRYSKTLRKLPPFSRRLQHMISGANGLMRRRCYTTSIALFERSAFLACGLRMINSAFDKTLLCLDPQCQGGNGEHVAATEDCPLARRIVWRGLWYLRVARNTVKVFSQDHCRRAVRMAEHWDSSPTAGPLLPKLFALRRRSIYRRGL